MSDKTEADLRRLLAEVTKGDVAGLSLDDDLVWALGLDSLGGLRLLAAVEKRFGVRFPDEQLGRFRTLRQLLDVIGPPSAAPVAKSRGDL